MFDDKLLQAWADHIGCDINDNRVQHADECGWPHDFRQFRAGWEAALATAREELTPNQDVYDIDSLHARMWHSEARRLAEKYGEQTFYNAI